MSKNRKFLGYCEECKKSLCEEHAYFYVDGNNVSITNSSPYLCKDCYSQKYSKPIISEVDIFKQNLINNFENLKRLKYVETIRIDKIIEYIKNV